MDTNFTGPQASPSTGTDPQYLASVKTFTALVDEIIAQRHAINTHMISLSTLKKWADKNIDIPAINVAEGPLEDARNSIARALLELGLTVWQKYSGKKDYMIYLDLAIQIHDLTPQTLEAINSNRGMVDEEKNGKPSGLLGGVVVVAILLLFVYLFMNKDSKKQTDGQPVGVVSTAPTSFTTINDTRKEDAAATGKVPVSKDPDLERPFIKLINTMDKPAKFILFNLEETPVKSCLVDAKGQGYITEIPQGLYTFKVATGNEAALRQYIGKSSWKDSLAADGALDTLVVLDTEKKFSRTTMWLEKHAIKGLVYDIHQEMSVKTRAKK